MAAGVAGLLALLLLAGCQAAGPSASQPATQASTEPAVLAVESFLADITQQVAGERLTVQTLMPLGLDPHAFEPTPQDVARIADADLLIVNGAGFEEWLQEVLENAGGERRVVEAASGLESRVSAEAHAEEDEAAGHDDAEGHAGEHEHAEGDPHFWLDPANAKTYVANIRDGLAAVDPEGAAVYAANADAYITQLEELDTWIQAQIAQVPPERRLLVTNHESFGYYADRYGLRVVGTVIPSVSTGASPSAQQLAALADEIKATGVPVIFLETGANPQLAQQLAVETGVKVVTDLYSHSLTTADGPAPTYLDLMRYNTDLIVDALMP